MTDELDLDPAFYDIDGSGGGLPGHAMSSMSEEPMSEEEDQQPASAMRGGRSRRGRVVRRQASEELNDDMPLQEQQEQQLHLQMQEQDGFSLADELAGGGAADMGQRAGDSLGDELNGIYDQHIGTSASTFDPVESTSEENDKLVEAKARRDQEHYLVASESLADSVRATENFLSKLNSVSQATSISNTTASSQYRLTRQQENGAVGQEDTSRLEQSAATVVKQLREHTTQREMQVRELREAERVFARGLAEGGDWLNAMGSIDEDWAATASSASASAFTKHDSLSFLSPSSSLPGTSGSRAGVADAGDLSGMSAASSANRLASVAEDEVDEDQQEVQVLIAPGAVHSTAAQDVAIPGPKAPASQQMKHLQQCTGSLISSLGMLHEHSQVARAEMSDAARRLRSLKTVLVQWRTEVEEADRSRAWIAAWEGQAAESEYKRPENIKQWTKQQMERFEKVLGDAETRARELLQPVAAPKLDELAKQASAGAMAAATATPSLEASA